MTSIAAAVLTLSAMRTTSTRVSSDDPGVLEIDAIGCCTSGVGRPPGPSPTVQDQVAVKDDAAGSVKGSIDVEQGLGLHSADLTRAIVYLASDPVLDRAAGDGRPAIVGQRNKEFVPNFLGVAVGTTVEFPNWDDFDHNVFSRSKAAPAFDLDRYPKGQSKSRVFEKTGVVQIFCNIHPQMRAIVVVTPNRFFARPDREGRFCIAGVPPGRYEIVAWHERCGEVRRPVEVADGGEAEVALNLEENRSSVMENRPPRHGGSYGVERGLGVKRERLDLPVVRDAHPAPEPPK